MDQIEKYKEDKATFMADTQQRKQQKLLESVQELEKCRKEIERLRSRLALLNELMAKDDDLIFNTIHAFQHA